MRSCFTKFVRRRWRKDELITFLGQEVKAKVMVKTKCGRKMQFGNFEGQRLRIRSQ